MKKMPYRQLLILILLTLLTLSLTACGHKHTYGAWETEKAPSCTEDGTEVRYCACKKKQTKTIPATGIHTYSEEITAEASCAGDGVKTFTCSVCKDSYTEPIVRKSYSATEIYDNHVNIVGEVITYDKSGREYSLGTCFVYSSDGKMITNYHVIEDAYSAKISLGGTSYPVQYVLAYDKDIDIAVLQKFIVEVLLGKIGVERKERTVLPGSVCKRAGV